MGNIPDSDSARLNGSFQDNRGKPIPKRKYVSDGQTQIAIGSI